MELDKFKTMMNVRKRMTYFLRFQRMAGSENQVTIDEEAWELILPDQWNLSGEHEKAIREGLEIFAPYFALFRTGQLKHYGQTTSP